MAAVCTVGPKGSSRHQFDSRLGGPGLEHPQWNQKGRGGEM